MRRKGNSSLLAFIHDSIVYTFGLQRLIHPRERVPVDTNNVLLFTLREGIALRWLGVDGHNLTFEWDQNRCWSWNLNEDALLIGLCKGVGLRRLVVDDEYIPASSHCGGGIGGEVCLSLSACLGVCSW